MTPYQRGRLRRLCREAVYLAGTNDEIAQLLGIPESEVYAVLSYRVPPPTEKQLLRFARAIHALGRADSSRAKA